MALKYKLDKDDFINLFRKSDQETLSKGEIKEIALKEINRQEIPHKKMEEWRHTSLNKVLQHRYSPAEYRTLSKDEVNMFSIPGLDAYRMVFVNGFFVPELSDISNDENGLTVIPMDEAKEKHKTLFDKYFNRTGIEASNFFTALNTAYSTNGSFIYVAGNFKADKPVQIMHFSDGQARKTVAQYRNLIIAEKSSDAAIVSTYHSLSLNYTLNNVITEIFLEDNARLNYNIIQGEGVDAAQFNYTKVIQESNSDFSMHTVTFCGLLVRNDLKVIQNGSNCETDLNGLYMPDREQHFDNSVFVHHAKPHNNSMQLYKGIIDNKASAVFYGRVLVDKGAQKTNANQLNKNILLTKYAKVNSKPQLEIYADDVACSHGSTTGQIDEEALFYMWARGINRRKAENLLLSAFVSDVIEKIKIEAIQFYVQILINNRLQGTKKEAQCLMIDECPACD